MNNLAKELQNSVDTDFEANPLKNFKNKKKEEKKPKQQKIEIKHKKQETKPE